MRHIAVIGVGECELLLAFALLDRGFDITVYSDRSPEQLLTGRLSIPAFLFNSSLQLERDLGLNFWEEEAPLADGVGIDLRDASGRSTLAIRGCLLDKAGQATDPRTKFSRWMGELQKRGGQLVVGQVSIVDLERIAASHDLTMIGSGWASNRGGLQDMFERDDARSPHRMTPRHLTALVLASPQGPAGKPLTMPCTLRLTFVAGVGEIVSSPFYAHTVGECRSYLFEAIPNAAMDRFGAARDGNEVLVIARQLIAQFSPEEWQHVQEARLVDPQAWLKTSFAPIVRRPVAQLPSGAATLAIGDTFCLLDPVACQAPNLAAQMADHLARTITARCDAAFDAPWMNAVMQSFWDDSALHAVNLTQTLLTLPGEALMNVLRAASQAPPLADALVGSFQRARDMSPWLDDVGEACQFITSHGVTMPLTKPIKE